MTTVASSKSPLTRSDPSAASDHTAAQVVESKKERTDQASLTLLHLSDLHFGQAQRDGWIHFDQKKVMVELIKDTKEMAVKLGAPDYVLITGDIAYSAKAEEYAQASTWLKELSQAVGVGCDRIWMVPGNHDVDRAQATQSLTRTSVHSYLRSMPKKLDDCLMDDDRSAFVSNLWPKFQPYASFSTAFANPALTPENPFWRRPEYSSLGNVLVIGVNSCLLSLDNTDTKHNLALSQAQLHSLVQNVPNDTLVLALVHHPPEWLSDGRDLTAELIKYPHILLTGHVHESGGGSLHSLGIRSLLRVSAGACHAAPNEMGEHAYSWIRLSRHGLRWYPRAYSESAKEFKEHSDLLRDGGLFQDLTLQQLPQPLQHWLVGHPVTPPPPPPAKLDGLENYLKATLERYQTLPLIGVNPELKLTLGIDDVYVPLRASVQRGLYHEEKWHTDQAEVCRENRIEPMDIDLSQVFEHVHRCKKRGVVILGAPGSGKTTLLKLLLVRCIRDGAASVGLPHEAVPVMLPLRDLQADRTLDDFVHRSLFEHTQLALPPDFASRLRQSRPVVYLLDGLDEVSNEEQRGQVSRWIQTALSTHTDAFFAVTCRYAGYQGKARFDNHFEELDVHPLLEPEAKSLVENFYRIVEKSQLGDTRTAEGSAIKKSAHLWKLLESDQHRTRRMRELQTNPLMLTILCLVHQRFNDLPDKRWRLYEQCIDTLLWHWRKAINLVMPFPLEESRRLLLPLAHWLHQSEGRRHATSDEVLTALASPLSNMTVSPDTMRQFLKDVRDRSGLLVGWGPDSYGFIHLAFQEHLAAKHLQIMSHGKLEILDQAARHFGESWWTEVILLLVSLPEPSMFEPFMRRVLREDRFAALEHRALLSDCVADGSMKSALPFLEVAADEKRTEDVRYAALTALRGIPEHHKSQVIALCRGLLDAPQKTLKELARELLEARGEKVIQRFRRKLEPGTLWVHQATGLEFVYVPAGSFMMGSDAADGEKPIHKVTFKRGFWIGKYPVTNEQYGRFLAANKKHGKPKFWDNGQWNGPQKPVVGVDWNDAKTFCQWADGTLHSVDEEFPPDCQSIVLPSEAQWEYAARGPEGRKYPWGNETPTKALANFNNDVGRTTPVGQYPKGASWVGAQDMAGNVWEWCADPWNKNYEDAPNDTGTNNEPTRSDIAVRVIRGGAWSCVADWVRAACRSRCWSGSRVDDLGFRVVCVSAEHG